MQSHTAVRPWVCVTMAAGYTGYTAHRINQTQCCGAVGHSCVSTPHFVKCCTSCGFHLDLA